MSRPSAVQKMVADQHGSIRARATTTPGRLVLVAILVIAGAVCFGVIAAVAEHSRANAAQAARTQTEPLLVEAVNLYTALSDANATATTTFLKGGLEPPATRAQYLQDLRLASDSVAALTQEVRGSADARAAVRTITERLPVYSGLVEAARANNRQGFPVGAAYLRQASALLTGTILPEANRLYAVEARHLSDDYGTGTASTTLIVLAAAVIVALALLVVTQAYLARISRRVFNVPILIATAALLAISIWTLIGLLGEQDALANARRESDSVEVLSAARILLSRAQSDESLTLVSRGSDQTDPRDFAAVLKVLSPQGPLLREISTLAQRTGTTAAANRLIADFDRYQTVLPESSSPIADQLQSKLAAQIIAAQGRFRRSSADASGSLSGLWLAIPILTVCVAALALIGLRQRLGEYR